MLWLLNKEVLDKYSKTNEQFKSILLNFEKYVEENGPPFFDYKLYKGQSTSSNIFKKFHQTVKRLMRLNKSYKYADTTNAKAGVVVEEDFNKLSQRKCENNSLFYPVKNQEGTLHNV